MDRFFENKLSKKQYEPASLLTAIENINNYTRSMGSKQWNRSVRFEITLKAELFIIALKKLV